MREEELTITVNKLLQGFERARLSRSLRLLLVSLQHLVHVRILDAGQSPGAEHTQTHRAVQHQVRAQTQKARYTFYHCCGL